MRRLVVELTDAEYERLEQAAGTRVPVADLARLVVMRALDNKTPAEASAREARPGEGSFVASPEA